MDSKLIILSSDASLVGKDLANVYRHFEQKSSFGVNANTKFKKKESLDGMAKSILKHRIKLLTGKSVQEMEDEMDYKCPNEAGFTVEELRRIAQLLILEVSGELTHLERQPTAKTASPAKPTPKRGRKSLAPDMLKAEPLVLLDDDMLDLGPNPTPQMIARKRKSIAVMNSSKRAVKPTIAIVEEEGQQMSRRGTRSSNNLAPEVPETTKATVGKRRSIAVTSAAKSTRSIKAAKSVEVEQAAPTALRSPRGTKRGVEMGVVEGQSKMAKLAKRDSFSGENCCKVFLAQSPLSSLNLDMIQAKVPEFKGASLVVLHTPVSWDPTDVFNIVQAVRNMNKKAGLDTFSVLVGCGLTNVHLFREALYRQTKHVQFLVFERNDPSEPVRNTGKLRDVNTFFLLAYFFKDCGEDDPKEIPQMVRLGSTTCFHTKNVEDLENQIMHTFSEEGDWLFDIFCGGRELSLAAQKMGRNALALHDTLEPLSVLKDKAAAIATFFDKSFNPEVDGTVLQI